MYLPATLALVLCLLWGTLAQAQPVLTREPRRRSVTLTGAVLEVRIATGMRMVLLFSVPIHGKAVEVDRSRIRVVDTGERSIIIEPLSEPGPGERWMLRVPLADGQAPKMAEFALLTHPSEVDAELSLTRPEAPAPACQPACAPCPVLSAADAVASGFIDKEGVRTLGFVDFRDAVSGLQALSGVSYRAKTWVLVVVKITRPARLAAWTPAGATLKSRTGEARVRAVKVEPEKPSSENLWVFVETDVPPSSAGLEFTLHLNGPEGAPSLSIPKVTLPPAKEPTP